MIDLNNLKTITQEELDEMIESHKKLGEGYIFYLLDYNLSNIKIKNKNLQHAIIDNCLLKNITFENCNLERVVIDNCLLNNVIFEDCNLEYAAIKESKIINTNFINCNLSYNGFLYDEFLNSDLSTCNIKKSNFSLSTFNNIKMPDYPIACPEKGSFIGYKKVCSVNDCFKYYILKLEIPEDAKRSSAVNNKCRCNKVKVLEIQNLDGRIAKNVKKVSSIYNNDFTYKLDKIVEEPNFDECRWNECAAGIHFFMKREEAVDY